MLYAAPERYMFGSMDVDGDGNICVATIGSGSGSEGMGGISVIKPDGSGRFIPTGDALTTNIAFGGDDLQDAYITPTTGTGRLFKMRWHCKGHRCHCEEMIDPASVVGGGAKM